MSATSGGNGGRPRGGTARRPARAAVEHPRRGSAGEPGLEPERPADARALRVGIARSSRLGSDRPIVLEPGGEDGPGRPASLPVVDGLPVPVRLDRRDRDRAVLVEGDGLEAFRTRVLFGPRRGADPDGLVRRELVVDGWRVEVEIELERRAALRERARRTGTAAGQGGPLDVRAIIPGRVVSIAVAPGDPVAAGQRLIVIEAMKMQNELRAPRAGTVDRVAVAEGGLVELGDLLVVLG